MFAGHLGAALALKRTDRRVNLGVLLFVGSAVFSHFILDALVHPPALPVWGEDSPMIGLGGPPPPTATAAALPGIVSILAVAGVGFWADRPTPV